MKRKLSNVEVVWFGTGNELIEGGSSDWTVLGDILNYPDNMPSEFRDQRTVDTSPQL